MTYITEISEQTSQESIHKLYEEIRNTMGMDRVPNAFKVSSLDTKFLIGYGRDLRV